MAQTKPKAGQFYGVSNNGTDGEFLQTDGTGGMAWASTITNPTITSIDYPGSTTAADPAGGQSVIINGTLFASGITCTVGGTSAVTAFNSATQITITTPAKAAGPYTVAVLNPDGGTDSQANFIQYSGVPVWSTAAGTLGNVLEGAAASFQVTATEGSDTIEYAVTTGTLPTGLSLATATGAITGTAGSVSADTTTTFSITATDDENQTSASRSFSITVQNDNPSNHFNTVLYTGDGASSRSITGVGFAPDFTWTKKRAGGTGDHLLQNTVQGAGTGSALYSNKTNTAGSIDQYGYISAFGTDGVTYQAGSSGSYPSDLNNENNSTYVSWNFKAGGAKVANTDGTINSQVSVNNTLGFSIVSYTGNQTAGANIGHGLNEAPSMVILKNTVRSGYGWLVYHEAISPNSGIVLNTTSAKSTDIAFFNNTATTATTFTLGSDTFGNYNGDNYIAYCFSNKPGFSKVGSYTGENSSNGPIITTGFEPAFIMFKNTTGVYEWVIYDNKRSTSNPRDNVLYPNTGGTENSGETGDIDFLANGFKIKSGSGSINQNGATIIYIAFAADGSTATPSLANSFDTEKYTGTASTWDVTGVGFKPDFTWIKNRLSGGTSHNLFTPLYGQTGYYLKSNSTDALSPTSEIGAYGISAFNSNGFTLVGPGGWTNANGNSYVSWNWKAGGTPSINADGTITSIVSANQAAGFSVISWTGNSTTGATIGHGLNSAPELFITKNLGSTSLNWATYNVTTGNGARLTLNESAAVNNGRIEWNNTTPTASVITFSDHPCVNSSSNNYIGYAFTSISGYSKVGTYTGTGGALTVTTGFQPGFVMIKRTDSTGNWVIVDEERASGDSRLYANLTNTEDAGQGESFTSTGFKPRQSSTSDTNISGGTYIYLAIKEN